MVEGKRGYADAVFSAEFMGGRASADSNGGQRPYFREITASPNLTAATAAIAAILPAASPFLAQ